MVQLSFWKRLLTFQVSFVYQVAGTGRGLKFHKNPNESLVDWERGIISNCRLSQRLENSPESLM